VLKRLIPVVALLLATLLQAQQLSEVCLSVAALGLAGHPSHMLGAMWWNGTEWLSTPLYVEAKAVSIIYINELNKTNPSVGRAVVLPPALEPGTKLCMYLPRRNATRPPGIMPDLEGIYALVQSDDRATYHIFIATTIPAASPDNLTSARLNAKILQRQVHKPAGRRITNQPQSPTVGEIEPLYNSYYATTATYDYMGAFKLKQTDKYYKYPCFASSSVGGTIQLPPNTYAAEVVITAASTIPSTTLFGATHNVWIRETYQDGSSYTMGYSVYLSPSAPYATIYHVFKRGDAKTVEISLVIAGTPPNYECTFDAFVVIYGSASGYWQRFHVVSSDIATGTLNVPPRVQRSDGYYLVFPGYTVPPGVAYSTTYLIGSLTLCGTSRNYIDIYWGTTYVTRVYGQSVSSGCWRYTINTWIPPYENAKTGGSTDPILVGPIDGYTVTVSNAKLAIYGLYRPEPNRYTSYLWRDGVLPWLYAVYTTPFYAQRVEIKIYDRGQNPNTDSMRLAAYLSPYQNGALCPGEAFKIKLALNGGGTQLRGGSPSLYVQGGSTYDIVSQVLGWVAQLFATMGKILEKIGNYLSWLLLADPTVNAITGNTYAQVSNDYNYLVVSVNVNVYDTGKPIVLTMPFELSFPGSGGDYSISTKEVYMCGRLIYSDSSSIPVAQYYKPVSFINMYATQYVDVYRTFTCGKQEDLSNVPASLQCNVNNYR